VNKPNDQAPLAIYAALIVALARGYIRTLSSRVCSNSLALALLHFRVERLDGHTKPEDAGYVRELAGIEAEQYDAYKYVADLSHLVYAFTLFDSFLTDTTLFLLLMYPKAIGPKHSISLQSLLESSSKFDAIAHAARKKARELSYLPVLGRLEYLSQTFGLKFAIAPVVAADLEDLSTLRNTAVHDQGYLDLGLDALGELTSQQKGCAVHPTPVSTEQVGAAINAITCVSAAVARAVVCDVLKADPDDRVFVVINMLAKNCV
jgi:hypothetical protein